MNIKTLAVALAAVACLSACSSKRTVLPYFTDLTESVGVIETQAYAPEIKPDDELDIVVSSSVPDASAVYNVAPSMSDLNGDRSLTATPRIQTYLVDSKGDINFPILGKIHVAGLTTEQLQEKLQTEIRHDVKDAIVRVALVNFTVVVGGEVARPGKFPVKRNRYSVLDALGEAGDLTPYGERENVLVIREENGQRTYARLNLNSKEALTSPYFYLRQNDYVYVEPNKIRQANAKYNQDNSFKLQVISTIVSATSVVASLVIALAIK